MNYEKLLLAVGCMALISQSTTVVFISTMLLVGIPLLFAMIVFCNLLAMYPAVLLHRATGNWLLSIPAAALGVVAVEYGVPAYAQYNVQAHEHALRANDFGPDKIPISGEVEIQIEGKRLYLDEADEMCDDLCRGLLSRDGIRKVYVSNFTKAFAIELNHPGCRLVEDTPQGQRTHGFSHCYYAAEIKTVPPTEYTLRLNRPAITYNRWPLSPWFIQEEKTVETYWGNKRIASDKFISAEVASSPLFFNLKFSQGAPGDWYTAKSPYESRISRLLQ
jgi:hypothetical protein